MRPAILLLLLFSANLPAQQTSVPTALPSQPFFIRNTWFIGGQGSWSYLTLDPQANRLYIAHGAAVQVVDVASGALAGTIGGFGETRDIALDPAGAYGYISDGPRARVTVFDRGTLQKVAEIDTEPSPSALVFEPQTGLLFAVGSAPAGANAPGRVRSSTQTAPVAGARSSVTVIDPQTRTVVGVILLPGALGFARADGIGGIDIDFPDRNKILGFDAASAATELRQVSAEQRQPSTPQNHTAAVASTRWPILDWTREAASAGQVRAIGLGAECANPAGLAADGADQRLFISCGNMALVVVNAATGAVVTTLPVGPGADTVAFDPEHQHIFVANGGGDGSLTIIRRDVTDTYNVIQTLPTRRQARTMAVDPGTGTVYLVTDYVGVARGAPGGFGPLQQVPVPGSFQVLEIGQ